MIATPNKSGLLRASLKSRPKHFETEEAGAIAGMTSFDRKTKQATTIVTPPDALVRVHEMMHAKHTDPEIKFGKAEFVQQLIEDMRLHAHKWPWPKGQTPALIADSSTQFLRNELAN